MRDEGVVKNSLKGQKGDGLGDDKVYSNQEAAQRMQLKSFTAWVNLQLAKVSLKVNDLRTELEDGILLLSSSRPSRAMSSASMTRTRWASSRRSRT